ncbi:hypothetical protein CR513_00068, partial [Mucuna pruriens]
MFQDLHPKKGSWVTFESNKKGKIVGVGRIGLKHNLLSISQLCENGYDVFFNKGEFIVKDCKGSIIFSAKR